MPFYGARGRQQYRQVHGHGGFTCAAFFPANEQDHLDVSSAAHPKDMI